MAQASRRTSGPRRSMEKMAGNTDRQDADALKSENVRLQALVFELRTATPSVARLTDLAVWREREGFEAKTRRALVLLRKKDAKIRELVEAAVRRRRKVGVPPEASDTPGAEVQARTEDGDGGDGIDCNADDSSVVERLEKCVAEKAEQIEALLEEVARLRNVPDSVPTVAKGVSHDIDFAATQSLMDAGSNSCPKAVVGDGHGVQAEAGSESHSAHGVCRQESAEMEELRGQVHQLQSALANQATTLYKRNVELEQETKHHRHVVEESREREARLGERIETLERLQETARRTVLDREERLRQAEADRYVHDESRHTEDGPPTTPHSAAAADSARASNHEEYRSAAGKVGQFHAGNDSAFIVSAENDLEELVGAQDWWRHLAAGHIRQEGARLPVPARPAEKGTSSSRDGGGGESREEDTQRLRSLLEEQGLEIVALRQKVLKAEIVWRARTKQEEQREKEDKTRMTAAESSLKRRKSTENTRLNEPEGLVSTLRERGDLHEALVEARDEASAAKLSLLRAEGEVELQTQLLRDEKQRSLQALSRAEDLQGEVDRIAVENTLQNVAGGVSASVLIGQFAGTLSARSRHAEVLESKIRDMRTRCTRLARLARGDSLDTGPAGAARGKHATERGGESEEEQSDEWIEAAVQEAATAMEAGRRRALEEEVDSLRSEVLAERRRADAARRDVEDERRCQSLITPTDGTRDEEDTSSLRRKLALASSEIEALRIHTKDLCRQIQSGRWSWQVEDDAGDHKPGHGDTRSDASPSGVLGLPTTLSVATTLRDMGICDGHSGVFAERGIDQDSVAGASLEIARLTSLLNEKTTQVSVLTSTIEALQTPAVLTTSPRRRYDSVSPGVGSSGGKARGCGAQPDHARTSRDNRNTVVGGDTGNSLTELAPNIDGGVGVLGHMAAQGLARHCVALSVRLTSSTARCGAAERRADRLAAAMERRERKAGGTPKLEGHSSRRYHEMEKGVRKAVAMLSAVRGESTARLEEAGEEASKLRSALRDAELRASDARQQLESARAEGHALAVELRATRESHRDQMLRVCKEHETRIREHVDRLFVDDSLPTSPGRTFAVGLREVGTGAVSPVLVSPIASAIGKLAQQWHTYFTPGNKNTREEMRTSVTGGSDQVDIFPGGSGGTRGVSTNKVDSDRQLLASVFLQKIATRLDAECSRAIRYARALEHELRGVQQEAVDNAAALEEARMEVARLSARTSVAEAAINAITGIIPDAADRCFVTVHGDRSATFNAPGHGAGKTTLDGAVGGAGGVSRTWRGSCTVAATSLLEKRHAAAVEDLIATSAARAAAEAGEATAMARAEAAEAEAVGLRAKADVVSAELERRKESALDGVTADVTEWRREIRNELGQWWRNDLMHLHKGVTLDWGSSGLADDTAAAWTMTDGKRTNSPITAASHSYEPFNDNDNRYVEGDAVNVGVTGEEAMAQALIVGRAEQAFLEDRARAGDRSLVRIRGEALHLRAVLERWHADFVSPALAALRQRKMNQTDMPRKGRIVNGKELLERKLLAATADLLGASEEVTVLKREITALRALVARLQQDENEARKTAERRITSAREAATRRSEGDLQNAAERLAEERELFKSQLGAAHAKILRLGAEAAELERRNVESTLVGEDELKKEEELDQKRLDRRRNPIDVVNSDDSGRVNNSSEQAGQNGFLYHDGDAHKPRAHAGPSARICTEAKEKETIVEGVEGEREALRQMCNGLAVDLQEAMKARADAEKNRDALAEEAAAAKAEAKLASLARENVEVAVKELGRLLEFAREAAAVKADNHDGVGRYEKDSDRPLRVTALRDWDRPEDDNRRFARVMIAAKVAEADLLRRLQDAATAEAQVRHILRRRDIRIEELKRELSAADRQATSSNGLPWSTLSNKHSNDSNRRLLIGGASFDADGGMTASASGKTTAERTVKEVAMAATVKRLELELTEAASRGDVGEATTRRAERLALRLVPETGGVLGVDRCRWCGYGSNPGTGSGGGQIAVGLAGGQDRGASFLSPSVDVERKSAAAAAASEGGTNVNSEAADAPGVGERRGAPCGVNTFDAVFSSGVHNEGSSWTLDSSGGMQGHLGNVESGRQRRRSRSEKSPHAIQDRGMRGSSTREVSNGARSLEAHLALLERAGGLGVQSAADVDGDDAAVAATCGHSTMSKADIERGEAVSEVREQMPGLRDRASVAEEALQNEQALKQDLEEEVLRLRAELLRQQRSYWQAASTLKNRYERALEAAGDSRKVHNSEEMPTTANLNDFYKEGYGEVGSASQSIRHVLPEMSATATSTSVCESAENEKLKASAFSIRAKSRSLEQSLTVVGLKLQSREEELKEVRKFHAREAREAKAELTRAIEAQRGRVGALDKQLRRARKKIKALGRPKPSRACGKSRERALSTTGVRGGGVGEAGGIGDGGSGGGSGFPFLPSTASLSTDELLNMLAAADEEVFEAKGSMQRLEFELRAKVAEADALRQTATPPAADGTPTADETHKRCTTCAKGPTALTAITTAARLTCAEAEVERQRDEGVATSATAMQAQREVFALRLAARRRDASRADETRSREKEHRRQVSAYKREAHRLRSAPAATAAASASRVPASKRKLGQEHWPCKAGANTAVAMTAAEAGDLRGSLCKAQSQLASVRDESERRGRAILALRAAKTAVEDEVKRQKQELAQVEAKLKRRAKDVGVKASALKTCRTTIAKLEAELEAELESAAVQKATSMVGRASVATCGSCCRGDTSGDIDAYAAPATAAAAGGDVLPSAARNQARTAVNQALPSDKKRQDEIIRELQAERDRLRSNMRARQGSLSKQSSELEAQRAALARHEGEAGILRTAVARKDDAYRLTKKQLAAVREEYEGYKNASQRWRAEAETKWKSIKRASETAMNDAKTCKRIGDAADLELSALKSAFRSFLNTLVGDLKSHPLIPTAVMSNVLPQGDRISRIKRISPHAEISRNGMSAAAGVGTMRSTTNFGSERSQGLSPSGNESESGLLHVSRPPSPPAAGQSHDSPIAELTEAEVSDIMQELSLDSSMSSVSSSLHQAGAVADATATVAVVTTLPTPPRETGPTPGTAGAVSLAALVSPQGTRIGVPSSGRVESPPLSSQFKKDAAFSARVESALGSQNTSAALADMLRSMRLPKFSWGSNASEVTAMTGVQTLETSPQLSDPAHEQRERSPVGPPTHDWLEVEAKDTARFESREERDMKKKWHVLWPAPLPSNFAREVLPGCGGSDGGGSASIYRNRDSSRAEGGSMLSPVEEMPSTPPAEGVVCGLGGSLLF